MYAIQLKDLNAYCDVHSHSEDPFLKELERQTYLQTIAPQMISGRIQGRFLSLISKLKRPRYILEIGTFTGYSALCLAEGLTDDGKLHTIEISDDFDHIRDQYAMQSPVAKKIVWHKGDAATLIPDMNYSWDIVFMDAAKNQYIAYLDLLEKNMKPGSLLIADNVLWYGKVLEEKKDEETRILDLFNKRLKNSTDWDTQIFPLRDGISISMKK
jgi:caffeoyl-CoA O-methyltransferase